MRIRLPGRCRYGCLAVCCCFLTEANRSACATAHAICLIVRSGAGCRNDLYGARDAGCYAWLWGLDVSSMEEVRACPRPYHWAASGSGLNPASPPRCHAVASQLSIHQHRCSQIGTHGPPYMELQAQSCCLGERLPIIIIVRLCIALRHPSGRPAACTVNFLHLNSYTLLFSCFTFT